MAGEEGREGEVTFIKATAYHDESNTTGMIYLVVERIHSIEEPAVNTNRPGVREWPDRVGAVIDMGDGTYNVTETPEELFVQLGIAEPEKLGFAGTAG